MLILPPGHARTLAASRRFSVRERWILGAVLATVALLLAIVAISLSSSHASAHGCVDVTIPYSTGGQELYRCGAPARQMCAAVGAPGGYSGAVGAAVAGECRKAGLPTR